MLTSQYWSTLLINAYQFSCLPHALPGTQCSKTVRIHFISVVFHGPHQTSDDYKVYIMQCTWVTHTHVHVHSCTHTRTCTLIHTYTNTHKWFYGLPLLFPDPISLQNLEISSAHFWFSIVSIFTLVLAIFIICVTVYS